MFSRTFFDILHRCCASRDPRGCCEWLVYYMDWVDRFDWLLQVLTYSNLVAQSWLQASTVLNNIGGPLARVGGLGAVLIAVLSILVRTLCNGRVLLYLTSSPR